MPEADLDAIVSHLTAEQRAVVTAPPGPVLVVAGAGSGKTTTLVRRVAWLIASGVRPEGILLLTFTRVSAANMLAKARGLAPAARQVTGGTFHSVGAQVIRQLHAVFGLPERLTVLDPDDVTQAMRACMAQRPFPAQGRGPRPETVAAVISLAANRRCGWDEAVARRAPEWFGQAEWFGELRDHYTVWKLDRGLLDYDDLLTFFALALEDAQVGAALRARWPCVLVDEHQDSNPVQLDIVYGLGGPDPNVMLVGDPAQAIYGFRGSAPHTMFHAAERWPAARVLPLTTNYRSTQAILDVVNAVDAAMVPRFERTLRAASEAPAPRPVLVGCADERAQAEEVCGRVLAAREDGVALAEQAVLVRSMWAARRVEAELLAQRIPYRVVGGLRIDEAAHVKDVLSLARVSDNPRNEPAWTRIVGLLSGVGPAAARRVVEHVLASEGDAVTRLEGAPFPRKTDPAPLLAALRAVDGEGPPAARLRLAVAAFEPVLHGRYDTEWADRRKDLDTVAGLAEEHATLGAFLTAVTVDYSADKAERAGADVGADERPLTLSTIHSAKGLEWHTVHLPGLAAGHLPSSRAVSEDDAAEELRVFYVAVSRARRVLILYRPRVGDGGHLRDESPYEALVSPFVTRQEPGRAQQTTAIGGLEGARIDLRGRLLGRR